MDTKSILIVDNGHGLRKTLRDITKTKGHATIAAAKRVLLRNGNRIHSRLRSAFVGSTHSEQSSPTDSESLALLILILASLVIVMGTGLLLAIPKP